MAHTYKDNRYRDGKINWVRKQMRQDHPLMFREFN